MKYKVYKNSDPEDKHDWVTIYFHDKESLTDNLLYAFTDRIITAEELALCNAKLESWMLDQVCTYLTYYISIHYSKEA